MPKPYPKEFRQNVVEVAHALEAGTTLKEIAKDFGISESCLTNWIAIARLSDQRCNWPNALTRSAGKGQ
ncbi:transposase [Phycicoccus elongatus]|nr:transposase [Phycicoccus elongatus]